MRGQSFVPLPPQKLKNLECKSMKNLIRNVEELVELFIEYLNSLFFEGYAETLAITDPESYNFQFALFSEIYN